MLKYFCICEGKLLVILFYELLIRIRLSFEFVMNRLGGCVVGFLELNLFFVLKGEILGDIMRIVFGYVDIIVMRYF